MFSSGPIAAPYHDGDMAGVVWDGPPNNSTSTRKYYKAVAWNGLTSVEEKFTQDRTPYYLDGLKYLENQLPGDFSAQLKAFTYPDEFNQVVGISDRPSGMSVHDQKPKSFGLSYRTLIGDDISGTDRGYKLHLLYNLTAVPDNNAYASLGDQANPIEFGWALSGIPAVTLGYRATVHISLDSTKMSSSLLAKIEAILYGSPRAYPRLPLFSEIVALTSIIITDNGNGTWTAVGPDELITIPNATTFQIEGADAVYSDANTYQISST
jgi:hypothetical protein